MVRLDPLIDLGVQAGLHPSEARRIQLMNIFCGGALVVTVLSILLYLQSIPLLTVFVVSALAYSSVLLLNFWQKYLFSKIMLVNFTTLEIAALCLLSGGNSYTQVLLLLPISLSALLFNAGEKWWRREGYLVPVLLFIAMEYSDYSWIEQVRTTGLAQDASPYVPFIVSACLLIAIMNYFVVSSDKNEKKVGDLLENAKEQNSKLQMTMEEFMQNQEELHAMNKQLEAYQENLEEKVKQRTKELRIEKARLHQAKNEVMQLHDSEREQRQELEQLLANLKAKEQQLSIAFEELKASEQVLIQNTASLAASNSNLEKTKLFLENTLKKESEIREELENTLHELREAQTKLIQSEKMASLGQITAGVAHEINNPINFVLAGSDVLVEAIQELIQVVETYRKVDEEGAAEIAMQHLKEIKAWCEVLELDELQQELYQTVADIREGATRTAEIVRGLRYFSRMDEDELKAADLHEGMDATLVILRNKYRDRVEIIKKYDSKITKINCYPGKLNQVFMNIISNAIDAIEGEGHIYIETIDFEGKIEVCIQDTGSGIPEEIIQNIYDPFFTTKDVGKGTGLGLAIAYGIIEKHKGNITLQSKIGVGTTFRISIPKLKLT